MNAKARYRETRYPIRFAVRLDWDARSFVSVVENVSFRGLLLRTDAMPPLRLLVRVDLKLPDEDRLLSMHAMVAHATISDGAAQSSVGLQLYGISEEERNRWHAFVVRVRDCKLSPRAEHISCVTSVEPKTQSELQRMQRAAIGGSALFVETGLRVDAGDIMYTAVVHPKTPESLYLLDGVVERCIDNDETQGVLLRLRQLDADERQSMTAFVDCGSPTLMPPNSNVLAIPRRAA